MFRTIHSVPIVPKTFGARSFIRFSARQKYRSGSYPCATPVIPAGSLFLVACHCTLCMRGEANFGHGLDVLIHGFDWLVVGV